MKFEEINWPKTDEEDIYEMFVDQDTTEDKAEMLLYLIKYKPTLDLDFIDLFSEIDSDLLFENKPEIVENIVDAYAQNLPEQFLNDYEYLLKELINYYFFIENISAIEKHLNFIKKYPAKGIDLITIPVLWQLIYYGYYDQALDFSRIVWKPLFDDEHLWGNAHTPFCICIYLHELESAWAKIQDNQKVDPAVFYRDIINLFELDDDDADRQSIFYCLQNPFSGSDIELHIKKKEYRQANLKMNIWFLVYMKQNFDVPFMLSDHWWSIMSAINIYGKNRKKDYWYVSYNSLNEHFFKHTDNMLRSNQVEIFGKVKALKYVYHFINACGLISKESYEEMRENIRALDYVYSEYNAADLWQMTFIFKWPQLYTPDTSFEKEYRDSFSKDNSEMPAFESLQELSYNLLSPALQTKVKAKNAELFDDFYGFDEDDIFEDSLFDEDYQPYETYVREDPKTGRNDPCPCGSGKKFKKCCLNN